MKITIPCFIWQSLAAIALMSVAPLHGQTLAIPTTGTAGSGSTIVDFEFRSDGTIFEKGSGTSTLSSTDLQSSSRFIWYPALSALRAGGGGTETPSTVGQYSVALGYGDSAPGYGAISLGYNSSASGSGSIAFGLDASANNSFGAICIGAFSSATGVGAISIGNMTNAQGTTSIAMGNSTIATGQSSTTVGQSTAAAGNYSIAAGYYTQATAYGSTSVGYYNVNKSESMALPNSTSIVAGDPVFEVGNGTSSTPSDAFVVYKDGTAKFQGAVTIPQSGDIPMYTGN